VTVADVDPGPWASWAQIIALVLTVIGSFYWYDRRIQSRLDVQDANAKAMKERLDRELGPNSGGLREAVNSLKDMQHESRDWHNDHLLNYHSAPTAANRWRDTPPG
jgi:hypothetical protein